MFSTSHFCIEIDAILHLEHILVGSVSPSALSLSIARFTCKHISLWCARAGCIERNKKDDETKIKATIIYAIDYFIDFRALQG